jgi:hypothetical protein
MALDTNISVLGEAKTEMKHSLKGNKCRNKKFRVNFGLRIWKNIRTISEWRRPGKEKSMKIIESGISTKMTCLVRI